MTIRYSVGAEDPAEKADRTIALFGKGEPQNKVKADFRTYPSFWEKSRTGSTAEIPRTYSGMSSRSFGSAVGEEFLSTSSPTSGQGI
ncbi:hypothetical protein ACH41H_27105 [Streptomyces sp. NPDC020800]|uniref:hypothetical protein n=1 Tax=Streptomyces sp. NPDC020800 TaxID=3365092 RepID=UPI00379C5D2C